METLARDLLTVDGAPPPDFAVPPGEPALVPSNSPAWRVFANPVTLFVGGVAAVLLELAEPRVRHGVWDHSSFRTDPLTRLKRTGLAALVTVYGPAPAARAMIARIGRLHGRVSGVTDAGMPYRADDPELLDWVQATASWGFLEAYAAFDAPVSAADRDRYYRDVAPVAALYGAAGAPRSDAEAKALIRRMRPKLEPSATVHEFLAIMRRVPALPAAARPLRPALLKAAVSLLPFDIAEHLRLARRWRLSTFERSLVQTAARTAGRLDLEAWPSHQAKQRLANV
ncbi:MAG TPA: oxygenase MpaB family protein [Allosphingosinicella sp.]